MSDDRAAASVAPAPLGPLPEPLILPWLAILSFFLYFFWQSVAAQLLVKTKFFGWREGAAIAELAVARDDTPETRAARTRLSLWGNVLAFPFFLASLPLLLRAFPAVRPRDLGLKRDHLARHAWSGLRVGLLLIPLVLVIYLLVQWWFKAAVGGVPEEHPYSRLAESGLTPLEWVFLFLGAVVIAPFYEEFLFRGVVLRWFLRAPAWGWVGMVGAAAFAGLLRWPGIRDTWADGGAALWRELSPLLFILILFPHFWILRRRSPDPAPAAIFASAVLFAAFHSFAWPTPVPLLVLGIGLGWLANRQRSLVGPVVIHALFNGFAFVLLLLGAAAGK